MKLENLEKAHALKEILERIEVEIKRVKKSYDTVIICTEWIGNDPKNGRGISTKSSLVNLTEETNEAVFKVVQSMVLQDLNNQRDGIIKEIEDID